MKSIDLSWYEPEPELTVSEWADEHRILPAKASAEPGKWRTSRTPYSKSIMDALSPSSHYHKVVFCKGAQVGATELGNNWLGYVIHHAPGPMLAVLPTVEMAKRASKQRIQPMIDATPALRERVSASRERDSGNSLFAKDFDGGTLILTGANSAVGLRSMPARYLFLDEVDAYPRDIDGEGNPLQLAEKRTSTFRRNKKILEVSTPTILGTSIIWDDFQKTDKNYFYVPCPDCGHFQTISWQRIHWDEGSPETACLTCEECGVLIPEYHKTSMLEKGEWRPTAETSEDGLIGFHLSALYSPLGWYSWSDAVRDFIASKNNAESLKIFVNTVLGEPWEDRDGAATSAESLASRRSQWGADDLPDDVLLLTAGVDVQDNRLEMLLMGWGLGEQMFFAKHFMIPGNPGHAKTWENLDALLMSTFTTEAGRKLRIIGAGIDSGGHHTQAAYEFASARIGRNVFALKGMSGPKPAFPARSSKSKRYKTGHVFMIGVDTIKDQLFARFAINDDSLPGYLHFSSDLDDVFFEQLTAEKRVTKYNSRGIAQRMWMKKSGVRNEGLDCAVYAMAAYEGLKQIHRLNLAKIIKVSESKNTEKIAQDRKPKEKKPGFVGRWK